MPPPLVRARFADVIDSLSRRLGTPRFEPHITLSGGEAAEANIRARTSALAARLAPVPVHLTRAGYTDAYFRCLFVHAARTPALLAARASAAIEYERPLDEEFMPHLSLVYGELASLQKEKILDDLGREFDVHFVAEEITLCRADGTPDTWPLIGPFKLTGRH